MPHARRSPSDATRQRPGTGQIVHRGARARSWIDSLGGKVTIRPDGCWTVGDPDTYTTVNVRGETRTLHRLVYTTMVGKIPDGHHVHHTCEVKGCINPDHLRALTPAEHAAAHTELRHTA